MMSKEDVLTYYNMNHRILNEEQLMWLSIPDNYQLTDIPIDKLITYDLDFEESRLEKYKSVSVEDIQPILLGKEYKSGYQVVDGYCRIAVLLARQIYTIKAFVPIFKERTLYHVSPNTNIIETFYPRVPDSVMLGENGTEDRICVSDTLDGCFSSAPWGGNIFEDTMLSVDENGDYDEEKETGRYFRVYEFSTKGIYTGHIRFPIELHFFDYVQDAKIKGEYWLTEIQPYVRTYLIYVTDWDEGVEDLISYWEEKDLNNGIPYEEAWEGRVTTYIDNLKYTVHEDNLIKGF